MDHCNFLFPLLSFSPLVMSSLSIVNEVQPCCQFHKSLEELLHFLHGCRDFRFAYASCFCCSCLCWLRVNQISPCDSCCWFFFVFRNHFSGNLLDMVSYSYSNLLVWHLSSYFLLPSPFNTSCRYGELVSTFPEFLALVTMACVPSLLICYSGFSAACISFYKLDSFC